MISDEIEKLENMYREASKLKETICDKVSALAREWMRVFGFATKDLNRDADNISIEVHIKPPLFEVGFEYYAGDGNYDYWEQDIPALDAFNGYAPMQSDRLILSYDQIDNPKQTKAEWQDRMSAWRRWFSAERRKKAEENERAERKRYEELKKKFEVK